jgi:hypothetical protein
MKVKTIPRISVPRALVLAASFCMMLAFSGMAHAYSAELYRTDKEFMPGAAVALDENGQFELADAGANLFTGIAARQTGASFELVRSGIAHTLVSDIDGNLSRGDRVGLSLLKGVSSKLKPERQEIGTVLEDLSPTSVGWKAVTYDGNTYHIALLPVQLGQSTEVKSGSVVASLQRTVEKLLDKPVATWRIIAALTVGLSGVLLAFFLVISASREAFTSLGRNPLASKVILHGLWRIVTVALVIVPSSLLIAYLVVSTG